MIHFQFAELNRLAFDLSNAPQEVKEGSVKVVREVIRKVEDTSKSFVPRDTDELYNSISSDVWEEPGMVIGEAGPTARHGRFVEWGTSNMAPQAFMGPALDRHSGELEEALGEIGERAISRLGFTFS